MEDTRDHKKTDGILEGDARRRFMRSVLADLRALEQMLDAGSIERDVVRIGAVEVAPQQVADRLGMRVEGIVSQEHAKWTDARSGDGDPVEPRSSDQS